MTAATSTIDRRTGGPSTLVARVMRRNSWTVALFAALALLLIFTKAISPAYGASGLESLAKAALPVAFAAVAQAVVVISGGVDLSIGPMMALTNVIAARLMAGGSDQLAVGVVISVLLIGVLLGVVNGTLAVITRVPDIVVTLAMSFVWSGAALLVLGSPGGSAAGWLKSLIEGSIVVPGFSSALVVLVVFVAIVWIPIERSRFGLSIYAVGSDRLAAFRSGVPVARTRIGAYAVAGLFSGAGGLALTMATGIGTPIPGPYTLLGIAAVVLGGVSLAGGRGGLVGPLVAVFILRLVRTDLTFLGVNQNYTTVVEGAIMVVVVMVGAYLTLRRART